MKRFRVVYRCKKCSHRMSRHDMMYSGGCCPYCGHNSRSTVCDVDYASEEYEASLLKSILNLFTN